MKCTKCGHVFDEGIFCPECGTKFDAEEAERIAKNEMIEKEKKLAEEKRAAEEKAAKEAQLQSEKRELELAKAKADEARAIAEQERLAKEKIEKEAELVRLKNEQIKIEQEMATKKVSEEKQRQEELSRTFNGVVYSSVAEMNNAKIIYDEEKALLQKLKMYDFFAIIAFVLLLITVALIPTILGWMLTIIPSVIFGIIALVKKTRRRGLAITTLIIDVFLILGFAALMIIGTLVA